jgi:putative membrane protein
MKRAALLFLLAGVVLAAFLIARSEWGSLVGAFVSLGFGGLAVVAAIHLALLGVMGLGWGALARGIHPARWFIWGRLVRDGTAEVLPLSQLGGFVFGSRALVLAGTSARFAAASTVVDVTMELVAQLFYTLLGLGLLALLKPGSAIEAPALVALFGMAALCVLFVLAQRRGLATVERAIAGLTRTLFGSQTQPGSLRETIGDMHRNRGNLALCFALHLACWMLVGCETWLMLRLLGAPVGLAAALVIDSLLSGLRSMAFMVPQALGVQEGGYMLLGALFGVTPEAALALSLVRRARDLAIGAPVLLVWQWVEGRRALRGQGA